LTALAAALTALAVLVRVCADTWIRLKRFVRYDLEVLTLDLERKRANLNLNLEDQPLPASICAHPNEPLVQLVVKPRAKRPA